MVRALRGVLGGVNSPRWQLRESLETEFLPNSEFFYPTDGLVAPQADDTFRFAPVVVLFHWRLVYGELSVEVFTAMPSWSRNSCLAPARVVAFIHRSASSRTLLMSY